MTEKPHKFLVVGFGGMGCRHAQSLIEAFPESRTYIFEPSDDNYYKNLKVIGQEDSKAIVRLSGLDQLEDLIDLCVIATSAGPRFDILKELLNYQIKYFILEKIVFQNSSQFEEILKTGPKENIYVNFVNRYFENYIQIKDKLNNKPFSMNVVGGDFGLGSNALHYFDLFKYLGASNLTLANFTLNENISGNKRGDQYKELFGQILISCGDGSSLSISSQTERKGDVEIILNSSGNTHILNESLTSHIEFGADEIKSSLFRIEYTSSLTSQIYKDILESRCLLPTLAETQDIHTILFESVNKSLNLMNYELCPIT